MLDFETPAEPQPNPLDLFKDKLDQVTDLGAMKHIYEQLSTRTSKAPPEAIEYVKQRLSQLTQADTIDLNPINAVTKGMGFATASDPYLKQNGVDTGIRGTLSTPLNVSKSAIERGVDKGVDFLGGAGLTLLSASEGWRGKPLSEAMQVKELGFNREKLGETRRQNDIQMTLEQRKQFQTDTKDAMSMAQHELATIRTYKKAAEQGDPNAITALKQSYTRVEKFYPKIGGQIWKGIFDQPDAAAGMLDALAQGQYDTTLGQATSLKDIGKPILDIMGNDKLMAINELRYTREKGKVDPKTGITTVKDKTYTRTYNPQEIEDLRKRGGLKSGAEVSTEQSEATIKEGEAAAVPGKKEKADVDLDKARRELSQQDLEEYTKLFGLALKQAGGDSGDIQMLAVALLAGKGGTAPEMGKVDKARLAEALRDFAESAPGISDKTRLSLHKAATKLGAKGGDKAGTKGTDLRSILEEEKRKAGIGKGK